MIVWLVVAAFATPDFAVEVAPDQPVPHVFVDEPLVLEFRATDDATATVEVALERTDQEPILLEVGTVSLRRNAQVWRAVAPPGLPQGSYSAAVSFEADGATESRRAEFCVIQRPILCADAHAVADITDANFDQLLALADMPVDIVRFSANNPDLDELSRACKAAGLTMALVLEDIPPSGDPSTGAEISASSLEARAETLARDHGGGIAWWEISGLSARPEDVLRTIAALRRGGSRAPVLAAVASPEHVESLLGAGVGKALAGIAVTAEDVPAVDTSQFRRAAERAGYERLPVHHLGVVGADVGADAEAARALIAARAVTAADSAFPARIAYDSDAFQPAYVYLSAMAHRLNNATFVGTLSIKGAAAAYVFRSTEKWILVCWDDARKTVSVDVENASDLHLTDACDNILPLRVTEGRAELPLQPEPVYLTGRGGPFLAAAAAASAVMEAKSLLDVLDDEIQPLVPLRAAIEAIASGNAVDRLTFMALVQALPDLEEDWHAGAIARARAVPALAGLARLVRVLAVLEQEKSEEFVESLQNVIARCGEYQSVYLMSTSANDTQHERGDWIMEEVNRLVTNAETLRDAGRPIEAVAVATLAEARARALVFAAAAKPLSEPEPEPETVPDDGMEDQAQNQT